MKAQQTPSSKGKKQKKLVMTLEGSKEPLRDRFIGTDLRMVSLHPQPFPYFGEIIP